MRIALPWNSFPQCAHLTSVAMPWRAGSFTTRTCPHSTPFTFTIAKGLLMGCFSYNTSTSSTLPKRAQKTLQILVVPDATPALPLLCEPQTLALGSWEHTSPCPPPLGSRPPSPLPRLRRSGPFIAPDPTVPTPCLGTDKKRVAQPAPTGRGLVTD